MKRNPESTAAVLRYIVGCWAKGGPLPGAREICAEMGWRSTNAAQEHVERLIASGALHRPRKGSGYGINVEHADVAKLRVELGASC